MFNISQQVPEALSLFSVSLTALASQMFCQGRQPVGVQGTIFLLSVPCGSKGVIAPVDVLFKTEAAQMDPAETQGNAEALKAAGHSLLLRQGDSETVFENFKHNSGFINDPQKVRVALFRETQVLLS